jgi:hypothetical protein
MRDKGLVFDEMWRARRTLGRPFASRWVEIAVGLILLLLLASLAVEQRTVAPRFRGSDRRVRLRDAGPDGFDSAGELVGGANDGAEAR